MPGTHFTKLLWLYNGNLVQIHAAFTLTMVIQPGPNFAYVTQLSCRDMRIFFTLFEYQNHYHSKEKFHKISIMNSLTLWEMDFVRIITGVVTPGDVSIHPGCWSGYYKADGWQAASRRVVLSSCTTAYTDNTLYDSSMRTRDGWPFALILDRGNDFPKLMTQ